MSDRTYVWNVGAAGEPTTQGYQLLLNRHVGASADPDGPYDPFGDGTRVYACSECGATWNADDLHLAGCSRRTVLTVEYALTLWQPYASLCVTPDPQDPAKPVKPVENRGWPVPSTLELPVRIGIHAAKAMVWRDDAPEAWAAYQEHVGIVRDDRSDPEYYEPWLGTLVGFATVTGCHPADECAMYVPSEARPVYRYCSRWAQPDQYHWELADPQPLDEPIPMRGRQKLWRLPEAVVADG